MSGPVPSQSESGNSANGTLSHQFYNKTNIWSLQHGLLLERGRSVKREWKEGLSEAALGGMLLI